MEWFLVCCGIESGGRKCLGRVEWLGVCWRPGILLAKSPSGCRIALWVVWVMRDFGGLAGLGRAEMSWEGEMVGGVLVSRGFAGRITLLVRNHPPDTK